MRDALGRLLVLAIVGCAAAGPPDAAPGATDPALLLREWRLEAIETPSGRVEPARATLTVTFAADGRLGGHAGPNGYGGFFSADRAGSLRVRDVSTTLIGGPEAERAGEYLGRVLGTRGFEVRGDELRLRLEDGGALRFRAADGL